MAHSTIRVRGRLSPLEYLLAASAKLTQADAVLRQAASVHSRDACLDAMSLEALQGHIGSALQVIANIRSTRNPVPPKPFSPARPQIISGGRVIFSTEEFSSHD